MGVVYKRPLADQDLVSIWLYTWQDWGEAQADRYLDALERVMQTLAQYPKMGHERKEFTPAVRMHPHAHHLVVYQPEDDGITVIRVLHKNMDVESHLD